MYIVAMMTNKPLVIDTTWIKCLLLINNNPNYESDQSLDDVNTRQDSTSLSNPNSA